MLLKVEGRREQLTALFSQSCFHYLLLVDNILEVGPHGRANVQFAREVTSGNCSSILSKLVKLACRLEINDNSLEKVGDESDDAGNFAFENIFFFLLYR